jgi:hypothetical protein
MSITQLCAHSMVLNAAFSARLYGVEWYNAISYKLQRSGRGVIKIRSQILAGKSGEKSRKSSVRIAGARAGIRTMYLPNISPGHYF